MGTSGWPVRPELPLIRNRGSTFRANWKLTFHWCEESIAVDDRASTVEYWEAFRFPIRADRQCRTPCSARFSFLHTVDWPGLG